jgi:hypothetical protein
MEGLGYWLFLLILYLLSAMMKRRQQKATRRSLEKGEAAEPTPEWAQSDFFKNLFGDLAQEELVEEPEMEYETSPEMDDQPPEREPEIIAPPLEEEKVLSGFELSTVTPYEQHVYHRGWETMFSDMDGIRRAIIMKEILDRPRALRRKIR